MKLLSLDTSTTSTGWAYFLNGAYTSCGLIDLKEEKNTDERLAKMVIEIYRLLSYFRPDAVAIETPVVVRNP